MTYLSCDPLGLVAPCCPSTGLSTLDLSPLSFPLSLTHRHSWAHRHTCRGRCVSPINSVSSCTSATLAHGSPAHQTPPDYGLSIFGGPSPSNTAGPQKAKPGSSRDITLHVEELLPRHPCVREFWLAERSVQRTNQHLPEAPCQRVADPGRQTPNSCLYYP